MKNFLFNYCVSKPLLLSNIVQKYTILNIYSKLKYYDNYIKLNSRLAPQKEQDQKHSYFKRSDCGVQNLLRITGVHHDEEALGKLWADASSRRGHPLSSADQKVRQQRHLLAVGLTTAVSLWTHGTKRFKLSDASVVVFLSIITLF